MRIDRVMTLRFEATQNTDPFRWNHCRRIQAKIKIGAESFGAKIIALCLLDKNRV